MWALEAKVNGKPLKAIIDSGATVSVVSKRLVSDYALRREESIPVQVANGQSVFTLGTTTLSMMFDNVPFEQKAQVLETDAFEAVLGMDVLRNSPAVVASLHNPRRKRSCSM